MPVVALWLFTASCGDPLACYECAYCKVYVDCLNHIGMPGVADSKYGASGSCWTTSQSANQCELECRDTERVLRQAFPDAGCYDGP